MSDNVELPELPPADATSRAQEEVSTKRASCVHCGAPLAVGAPGGGCVRCLLNFAFSSDDGQDSPSELDGSEPPPSQGRRYGHFLIDTEANGELVELGRGAMGVTYRGCDTVLQTPVALKVINARVAEHPTARTRFLREARSAALLRHPNVASVFHYGEQAGECFYAMELVDGETLEARVRRGGPLSAELALDIAAQVASALAAAEARGIVHRDLKPSNLMLAARNNDSDAQTVKVIDFGLAKVVSAMHTPGNGVADTRGGFVGTPAFASPEQYSRTDDDRIDTRSDIYSLGITLWYLLCGKMPFVGDTLTEIHLQQTQRALPLAQLKVAGVPAPMVALLRLMLAVSPADRPQSARELLEVLHRCQRQLLAASRRRFARLAGGLAFVVLATVAVLAWREHTRPRPAPPDRSLAVLPFENASPNLDDAFYTTGVQDEITSDLAHMAALKVVSPESANQYPPGPRDFGRIGAELGVRHLLTGRVRRQQERIEVEVRLVDVAKPAQPWTTTFDRRLTDAFLLQGEIARAIADRLQTPLSAEEKVAVNRPPTTDLATYNLYLQARNNMMFTAGEAEARTVYERSIKLLEEATQRDPNFIQAYCLIAYLEDELATLRLGTSEERAVDHNARAESALAKARRLRPDDGDVHLAQARHLVSAVRDVAQAKIELDLARRALPNSAEVETLAGLIAENSGRWDDAIRARERAVALNPRDTGNYNMLEQTYRMVRNYEGAERALERLLALIPPEEALPAQIENAMERLESRADLAPLRTALAAVPSGEGPAEVHLFRFLLTYFERDSKALEQALAAAPQEQFQLYAFFYPKGWFEGLDARLRGDPAAEKAAFTKARAQVETWLDANPTRRWSAYGTLAMIDAALGRKDDAVREGKQAAEEMLSTVGPSTPILHCNLAVVYAWTDQPDLALKELETWTSRPAGASLVYAPTYGDLKLNPVWDPLRSEPRFAALLKKLAPPQ